MKLFRANERYYSLSTFVIRQIPIMTGESDAALPGETLARTLCQDACYLSADGGDQTAIELIRIADGQAGKSIVHLLVVRCQDRTQRGCHVRHEACVQGMTSAMQQNSYTLEEISFEAYLSLTKSAGGTVSWEICKSQLQEKGMHGTYVSMPTIESVDWERIYSALDGSGCSLSVQVIPALPGQAERAVIQQNYARTSQAAEGVLANMRDPLAIDSQQRWKFLSERSNSPIASVNIIVQGSEACAALVCARVQQAIHNGPFLVCAVSNYAQYTVYDLPWRISGARQASASVLFDKWTCEEAAKLLAFPAQRDSFTGVPGNPFSLLSETELISNRLTGGVRDCIPLGKAALSGQPIALPLDAFLLHTGIFGKSGVGKTTLLKQMIRHFAEKDVPVLILEPVKREYRELIRRQKRTRIFTVESSAMPLLVNPFRVPAGVTLGNYRSSLLSAFKAAFSLPDPLPALFEKAISEAYLQYGWTDRSQSTDDTVTVFDTAQFIRVFRRVIQTSSYSAEVKGNMMAGGAFRLQSLLERCPKTFDTWNATDVSDLLNGTVTLEMGNLEPEQKALVSSLILIRILAYLKSTRESSNALRNIILIDEAHALLDQGEGTTVEEKTLNSTMNQLLVNLVTEIRAYGVGIILSDQSPSRIGEKLLDNVDNVISFRLSGKEAEMLQSHIGAKETLRDCLPLLGVGETVLSNHYLRQPLAVKIYFSEADKPAAPVSDSRLIAHQKTYLTAHAREYCPYSQCQAAGCGACAFGIREAAQIYGARLYAALGSKLSGPEILCGYIVKIPAFLVSYGCDPTHEDFPQLCTCTAVHLFRKSALEKDLALSERATAVMLEEMQKRIYQMKEEA